MKKNHKRQKKQESTRNAKYEGNGTWYGMIANEVAETNRLLRIMIYCYLQTHLQITKSPIELEEESLELLGDKTEDPYE